MTSESDREAAYREWINAPLPAHPSNLAFYAGWDAALQATRPRVVETVPEQEALPYGSVIRDQRGNVVINEPAGWERDGYGYIPILPATVLFVGGDGE